MSEWHPIATAPKDKIVDFWVVPLSPEESFTDTSGKPIFSTGPAHRHTGRLKSWGAPYKATHWMPLPSPPVAEPQSADAVATPSVTGEAVESRKEDPCPEARGKDAAR